jgi:hypothetical protein
MLKVILERVVRTLFESRTDGLRRRCSSNDSRSARKPATRAMAFSDRWPSVKTSSN